MQGHRNLVLNNRPIKHYFIFSWVIKDLNMFTGGVLCFCASELFFSFVLFCLLA